MHLRQCERVDKTARRLADSSSCLVSKHRFAILEAKLLQPRKRRLLYQTRGTAEKSPHTVACRIEVFAPAIRQLCGRYDEHSRTYMMSLLSRPKMHCTLYCQRIFATLRRVKDLTGKSWSSGAVERTWQSLKRSGFSSAYFCSSARRRMSSKLLLLWATGVD